MTFTPDLPEHFWDMVSLSCALCKERDYVGDDTFLRYDHTTCITGREAEGATNLARLQEGVEGCTDWKP